MNRWWLAVALALSLGINLGLAASFWLRRDAPRPPRPPAGPPRVEELADRLGLEEERRQRFVELHREFFAHLRQTTPRVQQQRRELYRELLSERPDPEQLRRRLRRLMRGTLELEQGFVELTLKSRQLLDPRQERLYLRFVTRRMRPLREALENGSRPPFARPGPRPQPAAPTPPR